MRLILWTVASAGSAVWLLRAAYFKGAPLIWAQNLRFDPAEHTIWMRDYAQQFDGLEIYALYLLVFAAVMMAVGVCVVRDWTRHVPLVRYPVWFVVCAGTLLLTRSLGFHPPLHQDWAVLTRARWLGSSLLVGGVGVAIVGCGWWIERTLGRAILALALAVLLIPVCFIAFQPYSQGDYAYVLGPALRLIQGANPRDVYSQYDWMLPLVAKTWMELGLDPERFFVLAQASFFLLFCTMFWLARRIFRDKWLALFLLVSVVVVRIYSGLADPVLWLQVTPLRLDWWIVPLILVELFGPRHWTLGLFALVSIVFHRNLGLIYAISYLQLLVTLGLMERGDRTNWRRGVAAVWFNVLAMVIGLLASIAIFDGPAASSVYLYQKIGLGFIRIAESSFYWYATVMIATTAGLLFAARRLVSQHYFTTGVFLLYLSIGSSIYFFGRSHEANIIHLGSILVFVGFLMLDVAGRIVASDGVANWRGQLVSGGGGVVCVLVIAGCYGDVVVKRVATQRDQVAQHRVWPSSADSRELVRRDLASVRAVTGDSRKVYFLVADGFLHYYYGQYPMSGYFNPYKAWLFNADLQLFLQAQLDAGYFVVCDIKDPLEHELPGLRFTDATVSGAFRVMSRRPGREAP